MPKLKLRKIQFRDPLRVEPSKKGFNPFGVFHVLRFHTTFRVHHKLTKYRLYKRWHDYRYAHHVHVAVLALYIVGILIGSLTPGGQRNQLFAASGSFSQTTFAGSGDGTYTSTQP